MLTSIENIAFLQIKKGKLFMNTDKKWKCTVCGYITDHKIDKCPVCNADWSKFVEIEESNWACSHQIPEIDITKISGDILEKLRGCFLAETAEVGLYKAAARQAFREGYPEIGLLMDHIASEEAGHAARFAEILGEKVSSSTKTNLKNFINGERGAGYIRLEIATYAKQNNLDALHDSVHDISKDEQRHGAAFEGIYKRFFQ
ncbi:MAG: ferritin family protein [Mycoplasma sp.]